MIESIDELVVIKDIDVLRPLMANKTTKESLRLLCVFGTNASEVLFATNDDNVYGFGHNRNGCLGS